MRAYERLLNYVTVHTTSDETSTTCPSTARQLDLAHLLLEEMKNLGIEDTRVDKHGYVYGTIPATKGYESYPSIGLIAHMDTAPDAKGENVKPQVIENYNGEDVVLPGSREVLQVKDFPHLTNLKGRTLITTDGTTLLGADDKAGIAEIMTVCEVLLNTDKPHGKVCIGFTPDEEIGRGADLFDVEGFGADFAYTIDGGPEGEIEFENFNAASAVFKVRGISVHPGSAKNIMVNAALVACEINSLLPNLQTPSHTEEYEGFFHMTHIEGDVNEATVAYIIRDHNDAQYVAKQQTLTHITKILNEKYGEGTVNLTIKESYRNMVEKIKPCYHIIENAEKAIEALGMVPVKTPIRGGTDGARLSFMGLPCPNLGTGGYAFHGPYEHITAEGMDTCVEIILGILEQYSK